MTRRFGEELDTFLSNIVGIEMTVLEFHSVVRKTKFIFE